MNTRLRLTMFALVFLVIVIAGTCIMTMLDNTRGKREITEVLLNMEGLVLGSDVEIDVDFNKKLSCHDKRKFVDVLKVLIETDQYKFRHPGGRGAPFPQGADSGISIYQVREGERVEICRMLYWNSKSPNEHCLYINASDKVWPFQVVLKSGHVKTFIEGVLALESVHRQKTSDTNRPSLKPSQISASVSALSTNEVVESRDK